MWWYVLAMIVAGMSLYYFGKNDEAGLFAAVAFFMLLPPGVYYVTLLALALESIKGLLVVAAIITYFSLWMWTLYAQAGEDEKAWFVLTFLFSPLWIVYRVTQK